MLIFTFIACIHCLKSFANSDNGFSKTCSLCWLISSDKVSYAIDKGCLLALDMFPVPCETCGHILFTIINRTAENIHI